MAESKSAEAATPGDDLLDRLKGWYKADVAKANIWRKEAAEDFKFRDGDQWSDEEKEFLAGQDRPVLVFNRTGVLVDAVVGSEIGNRREVRYIPREQGDSKPNEALTSIADWFRDQCDAEDEESEAFKDAVTSGMGWTETRMDVSDNPLGDPKIERLDPLEMVWDHNSRKANLVDAKRLWRVRKVSREDAAALFPDADEDDLNAAWADSEEKDNEPSHNNPGDRYSGGGEEEDRGDDQVTLVECQYFDVETYYLCIIRSPDGQAQQVELDEEKKAIAEKEGALIKAVKAKRRRVVQCFLGRTVLKQPEPIQTKQFSWSCMTGLADFDKGTFYGIVRRAKDPQRWANKWLSQMMHILNSQAKGGVMVEKGVFENDREAEQNWARPEGITVLTKGALSTANGAKIQPKPVAQFPAGFDRLLQYADDAIVKATGINMEMLGMREVNQPGVLEYQRKQQGIAILASFFDGLRRYRKIQGRGMLALIQNIKDDRMVRIVGEERAGYYKLDKGMVPDVEYDIIIDDSPSSTNEKEKTWALLMQVLPMFKDAIGPKEALMMAEYSPLPTSLVEKIKASVEQGQGQPDPMQQAMMQLEQAKMANAKAEIELQMVAEQNKAREIEIKAKVETAKLDVERQRLGNEELALYSDMNKPAEGEGGQAQPRSQPILGALNSLKQSNDQMMSVLQLMAAPKEIVRDANGRSIGVRTVLQ